MARRSSARLRNRNSSTPKRVSLSHDAPGRTPRTAPVKLASLDESDEMPGAFPRSASPPAWPTAKQNTSMVPVNFNNDTTPQHVTPIKPAENEMHPKQHQQSTAKPMEEARWLGFANLGAHTEPPKQTSKIATLQGTPTKAPKVKDSPKIQFTFRREQSLELSPEAKKLMYEKREEAARIREQMIADDEGLENIADIMGRKMITPKSKKGRFSAAHMDEFKKMDSIAGHASAFRADPSRKINANPPTQTQGNVTKDHQASASPSKSLKRTTSKAQLDDPDSARSHTITRVPSKPSLTQPATQLPCSTSSKNLQAHNQTDSSSPAKRFKRHAADDASTGRPPSSEDETVQPTTPQTSNAAAAQSLYPDLSTITTPTQASLARAASTKSVKSSKIPGPMLNRSPSKPSLHDTDANSPKPSTPLLARSPSKASLFGQASIEKPKTMMGSLLMRSPLKGSTMENAADAVEDDSTKTKEAPLLTRSPLKMSMSKDSGSESTSDKPTTSAPLLARSPLKMPTTRLTDSEAPNNTSTPPTPLLSRSPAKVVISKNDLEQQRTETPTKPSGNGLMGRFNLLRSSPMKSILRSPQRLYSNDPAKVAAGTHLATPPKLRVAMAKSPIVVTTPAEKHVDFSSSTKARYERAQSELSSTPSKGATPPAEADADRLTSPNPSVAEYPSLPKGDLGVAVTPPKRRQTAAPGDFTFCAGEHGIIFGQSPNAPASSASRKRPSTIRHVSAEPQLPTAATLAPATGSKKRKFDFENDQAADAERTGVTSDKENAHDDEAERPAKRVKHSAPEPAPSKPASRLATLGVKPKKTAEGKDKKPSIISKARLNALAQPKLRT